MKKALMMASVASMIDLFNMDNIDILVKLGYQVEVACNFEKGSITSKQRVEEFRKELETAKLKVHPLPVPRSILALGDILASYKVTKKLCEEENYQILHCHSPIGGMISRLACRKARKNGTRVIYTAHGFHFFKGAPARNWIIYYTVERLAARLTDLLITMNKEDYRNAKKFRAKRVKYIPGVGIDVNKIKNIQINIKKKRAEFGLEEEDFLLFSAGQLSNRKNHRVIIRALAAIENKKVKLLICGLGELEEDLEALIDKLGLKERVILAGYREDVIELLHISDCFVFPSFQEGLPVALMEAMAAGLPIVASRIRGNVDLVQHGVGGYLVEARDVDGFAKHIKKIVLDQNLRREMSRQNLELVKKHDRNYIIKEMTKIYKEV